DFDIAEVKKPVLPDREAERCAELILVIRWPLRVGSGVPVDRVQIGVAEVLPHVAMDLIGSRLDASVHHTASRMPKLRTEVAGLEAELGERVRRGPHDIAGAVEEIN